MVAGSSGTCFDCNDAEILSSVVVARDSNARSIDCGMSKQHFKITIVVVLMMEAVWPGLSL